MWLLLLEGFLPPLLVRVRVRVRVGARVSFRGRVRVSCLPPLLRGPRGPLLSTGVRSVGRDPGRSAEKGEEKGEAP